MKLVVGTLEGRANSYKHFPTPPLSSRDTFGEANLVKACASSYLA